MNWLVFITSRGDEKLFRGRAGEKRAARCGAFCVVGLFFCQCQASISKEIFQKEGKEGPTQGLKTHFSELLMKAPRCYLRC